MSISSRLAVKEILDRCYAEAVEILKANHEDMDKVVAYLMEKETITGAEMVAIIEGRDPELVDDPYASTQARPKDIEAPARKVHMISEKIEMPALEEDVPAPEAEESTEAASAAPESAPEAPAEPAEAPEESKE